MDVWTVLFTAFSFFRLSYIVQLVKALNYIWFVGRSVCDGQPDCSLDRGALISDEYLLTSPTHHHAIVGEILCGVEKFNEVFVDMKMASQNRIASYLVVLHWTLLIDEIHDFHRNTP
jgi:hypothetical protein